METVRSNDGICVSLPEFGEGWYRKAEGGTGELFLSVAWSPGGMDPPA
jgi:hypothetical protein